MPLSGVERVEFYLLQRHRCILDFSVLHHHRLLFEILRKPIFFASASLQAAAAAGAGQQKSPIQNLPHRRHTSSQHQSAPASANEREEGEEEEHDQLLHLPAPFLPRI